MDTQRFLAHGLASTYTNHDCRCEPCKEAKRLLDRTYHQRRKTVYLRAHGDGTGNYLAGCRCQACKAAHADEQRRRFQRRRWHQ